MLKLLRTTIRLNGTRELVSEAIAKNPVLFGRGSGCDVILSGDGFSLNHARISYSAAGVFSIEDLNSLSGVSVNGRLVKSTQFTHGDTVKIGSLSFQVGIENHELTLASEVYETLKTESQVLLKEKASAFSVAKNLPSIRVLSWIGIILVVAFAGLFPFLDVGTGAVPTRLAWSSGQISSHHKGIEANCVACHDENFSKVSDNSCKQCHAMSEHGLTDAGLEVSGAQSNYHAGKSPHTKSAPHSANSGHTCAGCHQEHNGSEALVPSSSALCTSCHTNITAEDPKSTLLNVASWDTHPGFFGGKEPKDSGNIKLNHKVHMQRNLRGANGPESLTCASCHKLKPDLKSFLPIDREEHCASCHSLGFDEELPNVEVPHEEPDTVYQFLFAQYAQLQLRDSTKTNAATRNRPGNAELDLKAREFTRTAVTNLARAAERELFTRTACKLCHEIAAADLSPKPLSSGDAADNTQAERSLYKVISPEIPAVWMKKAVFNHGAHQTQSCESCHGSVVKSVAESELTADANMPKIDGCKNCHVTHASVGKIVSDCTQCHGYHESLALPSTLPPKAAQPELFSMISSFVGLK